MSQKSQSDPQRNEKTWQGLTRQVPETAEGTLNKAGMLEDFTVPLIVSATEEFFPGHNRRIEAPWV